MTCSRLGALLAAALAVVVPPAAAQDPAHKTLDPVFVTRTDSDTAIRGRLLDIGPETLTLLVDDRPLDVPLQSVLRVEVGRDSVKNGALIGAIVAGAWCALVCTQGFVTGSEAASIAVANVGIGALIGAGIDAMHAGRTTIYRKERTAARLALRPAVAVGFRF